MVCHLLLAAVIDICLHNYDPTVGMAVTTTVFSFSADELSWPQNPSSNDLKAYRILSLLLQ